MTTVDVESYEDDTGTNVDNVENQFVKCVGFVRGVPARERSPAGRAPDAWGIVPVLAGPGMARQIADWEWAGPYKASDLHGHSGSGEDRNCCNIMSKEN